MLSLWWGLIQSQIVLWHWRVRYIRLYLVRFNQRHFRDAFALFYNAQTKKVHALNGSGRSPKSLSIEKLKERGITGKSIPLDDLNSVTVPGKPARNIPVDWFLIPISPFH